MKTVTLRKDLAPEQVTAIIDSREQTPFTLAPLRTTKGTLATGDYSIKGLTHVIAVERKSMSDLMNCIGIDRERFEREIQRLMAYQIKALVLECHISQIQLKQYRSQVHPNAALSSLMSWQVRGLPIIWGGDAATADALCAKFLYLAAKSKYREALPMFEELELEGKS